MLKPAHCAARHGWLRVCLCLCLCLCHSLFLSFCLCLSLSLSLSFCFSLCLCFFLPVPVPACGAGWCSLINLTGDHGDLPLSPIALADLRLSDTTLGNLGFADNSTDVRLDLFATTVELDRRTVSYGYSGVYLLSITVFFVTTVVLRRKATRFFEVAQGSQVSIDRYTVHVQGLPPHATREQVQYHFEMITGGEAVAEVVVLEDSASVSVDLRRSSVLSRLQAGCGKICVVGC